MLLASLGQYASANGYLFGFGAHWINGYPGLAKFGLTHWDTNKESDFENWRGMFGSFAQISGKIIDPQHKFIFINDDGSLK